MTKRAEQAEAQSAFIIRWLERHKSFSVIAEIVDYISENNAGSALLEENRRMREALEEILKFDTNCIGQEYAYRRIKTIAKAALEDVPK